MYVSGRITLLLNFSSQQLINASASVIATHAYASADRTKSAFTFLQASAVMFIQCPPGEIFFVANITCPFTFILKGLQSQKLAIAFCSSDNCTPASCTAFASL